MDKSSILKAFNAHYFEFLDDLIRVFPDKQNLLSSKSTSVAIKAANPTSLIKAWHKYVSIPYSETIDSNDLTFFLEKDYGQDLAHLSNSRDILKIIDTFREPVSQMDEISRAHTMKYIQNLCKLSVVYMKLQL